jgi:hypothetical protein
MFDDSDHQLKSNCRDLAETKDEHDRIEWWCSELNAAIEDRRQVKVDEMRLNLREFQRRRLTHK